MLCALSINCLILAAMSSYFLLLIIPGESPLFSYSSSTETTSGSVFCFEDMVVLGILILNGMLANAFDSVDILGSYGCYVSSITYIGFDSFLITLLEEGSG